MKPILVRTNRNGHTQTPRINTCIWFNHIQAMTTKAWSRRNLMRALKFRVRSISLEQMYVSFIRTLLEYCDSVCDNASMQSKKQLDVVHVEAARIITGATKLCSIEKLLSDLGWESLHINSSYILQNKLMVLHPTIFSILSLPLFKKQFN